jgi:hypothetical protein
MSKEIKAEVIRLKNEQGYYLAQVILTNNHGLYFDSDYGNYAYRWSETKEDFKHFLLRIEAGYLATKIIAERDYTYGGTTKKIRERIERNLEIILTALQKHFKEESKDAEL